MRRLLLFAALLATLRLAWIHEIRSPVRSAGDPPQPLVIPPGASAGAVGRLLLEMGIVRNRAVFGGLVFARGVRSRLKAGEYSLEGPLSLEQIVDMLARGDVVRHEITFPEGKSLEEMAEIAGSKGIPPLSFLDAARDPAPIRDLDPLARDLEGYLFPDTYEIPRVPEPAKVLVLRMTQRFRDIVARGISQSSPGELTLREVVTVASLVELETARPEERPRIAAVFRNRLGKRMPLQTDPTVIYALRKAGTYDGNIRKKDLDLDSPYNTYRHAGLPPGPIASPGRESLLAVLHVAPVKDLYFVSRNDGTHEFSQTLADHERAVDRYQRHRGGRS